MQILVFSDSHGQVALLRRMIEARSGYNAIYHLGDGASEFRGMFEAKNDVALFGHKGNCDSADCGFPAESIQDLCGVRIFACHGHTRHVKSSLTELMFAAEESGANICLYGHTHIPDITYHNGIWFINPGAVMIGRYAMLTIDTSGTIYPSLHIV